MVFVSFQYSILFDMSFVRVVLELSFEGAGILKLPTLELGFNYANELNPSRF